MNSAGQSPKKSHGWIMPFSRCSEFRFKMLKFLAKSSQAFFQCTAEKKKKTAVCQKFNSMLKNTRIANKNIFDRNVCSYSTLYFLCPFVCCFLPDTSPLLPKSDSKIYKESKTFKRQSVCGIRKFEY